MKSRYSSTQVFVSLARAEYEAMDPTMSKYLWKIKDFSTSFKKLDIQRIPISKNALADALSHVATFNYADLKLKIYVKYLNVPSIEEAIGINQHCS